MAPFSDRRFGVCLAGLSDTAGCREARFSGGLGLGCDDGDRDVVGAGYTSRLYKTTDGCVSWKLLATNTDKDGFWDAIAFSDEKTAYCLAIL